MASTEDKLHWLRICGFHFPIQARLREAGIPPGSSWETIAEAITENPGDGSTLLNREISDIAEYGRKSVTVYSLRSKRIAGRLFSALGNLDEFPSEPDITAPSNHLPHTFEGVVTRKGRRTALFSSIQQLSKKISIKPEMIDEDYRADALRNVQDIFGIERVAIKCFDAVEVDHEHSRIIVRVSDEFSGYTTSDRRGDSVALVHRLGDITGIDVAGTFESVDLFPAIETLYQTRDEGRVVDVHFECSTGVTRYARARNAKESNQRDLRDDPYDKAALEGTDIKVARFGIAVAWEPRTKLQTSKNVDEKRELELVLLGSRTSLYGQGKLTRAQVHKAYTRDDYEFVLERLMKYSLPVAPNVD